MKSIKIYFLIYFVFSSQMILAQWVLIGLAGKPIKDIVLYGSNIYAVTSDSGSVFRSVDNGNNWEKIIDLDAVDLAVSLSGKLFMVHGSSESALNIYSSKDSGNTWSQMDIKEQVYDSLGWSHPQTVTVSPSGAMFCQLKYMGLLNYRALVRSTDDGDTWSFPGHIFPGGHLMDFNGELAVSVASYGVRGGSGTSIHTSSDFGTTWNCFPCVGYPEFAIGVFSNNNILYGVRESISCPNGYLLMTSDAGITWETLSELSVQTGLRIKVGSSEYMLIGTDSGIYVYSDREDGLDLNNAGLSDLNIKALVFEGEYLYAGTGSGISRRHLAEVTSAEDHSVQVVPDFNLLQNYPNPFNPSTAIRYSISSLQLVTIKVFDLLGNEIETLINEKKPAGTYEITWYTANLPSGIYFYRLQAGSFIQTKKMILMK